MPNTKECADAVNELSEAYRLIADVILILAEEKNYVDHYNRVLYLDVAVAAESAMM